MKQSWFTIEENVQLCPAVRRLCLRGDTTAITAPGQFVNLRIQGLYLRRPISVCCVDGDRLTLIYKVVGKGTAALAGMGPGAELDLLTGLGNGYDCASAGDRPLLLGGGVGVPPLYGLARELIRAGKQVTAVLGFNHRGEVFYEDAFRELGAETIVTTVDGSYGVQGFVTAPMPQLAYSYFYACGPEPMLKAVCRASRTEGQLSFERRMGCGFGACMGCSCETLTGHKRICREGPVLRKEEVKWGD